MLASRLSCGTFYSHELSAEIRFKITRGLQKAPCTSCVASTCDRHVMHIPKLQPLAGGSLMHGRVNKKLPDPLRPGHIWGEANPWVARWLNVEGKEGSG